MSQDHIQICNFHSEIDIDTNLASLQEGHLVTVLFATLRQDAHQKHEPHNKKCICLLFPVLFFISMLLFIILAASQILR